MSPAYPRPDAGRDYERRACCSFARRFVVERTVAVVEDGAGPGTRLLAGDAASMVSRPDLSDLPAAGFDVVVVPGFAGRVEDLARGAKRILKPDGLLVFSTPDGVDPGSGDYSTRAAGLGESLKGHFGVVRSYRLGTVAGAAVFQGEEQEARSSAEGSASFSANPASAAALAAGSLLAVCGDAGVPEAGGLPYLALDPERRVFEELEELSEEVDLLRGEILRMQESEAQAFGDTLTLRVSEVNHFRDRMERAENHAEAVTRQNEELKRQLHEIQDSRSWRLLGVYRGLATRLKRS